MSSVYQFHNSDAATEPGLKLEAPVTKQIEINIYTANHKSSLGIEDLTSMITDIFSKRGILVAVTKKLDPSKVNVIIDEFTDYMNNRAIAEFKRDFPNSKVVLVLTEFTNQRYLIQSANHFGGLINSAIISFIDVYVKKTRRDLGSLDASSLIKALVFLPLLSFKFIRPSITFLLKTLVGKPQRSPAIRLIDRNWHLYYMHMRYLGLQQFLPIADGILTSHEAIALDLPEHLKAKLCGVIYPEMDPEAVLQDLMNEKDLFIEITGSVTRYRKQWAQKINDFINMAGLHGSFGYCKAIPFSGKGSSDSRRGAYSLHPPQTHDWKYSSPTRLYRALVKEHNVPILTRHFKQNPIEDVCILIDTYHTLPTLYGYFFNRVALNQMMRPKVEKYAKVAAARNDEVVQRFRALF